METTTKQTVPRIDAEDPEDLNTLALLGDAELGYDPMKQTTDLSKDEKRRMTALVIACGAYKELIIREADYLREASMLAERGTGPKLEGASIDAIVEAAMKFDLFIESGLRANFRINDQTMTFPEQPKEEPTSQVANKPKPRSKVKKK